ncbi:MAG: CAP domain-containing protein [Planctomycetota bacterium]
MLRYDKTPLLFWLIVLFFIPALVFTQPATVDEQLIKLTSIIEKASDEKAINTVCQSCQSLLQSISDKKQKQDVSNKISELLTAKLGALLKKITIDFSDAKQWGNLKIAKEELNKTRQDALKTIFDLTIYPDGEEGKKNQKIVDKKVEALKAIWESKEPANQIPKTTLETAYLIETLKEWIISLKMSFTLPVSEETRLLHILSTEVKKSKRDASDSQMITVKNFAINKEETEMLLCNKRIWEYNAQVKTSHNIAELQLAKIMNEYREMMGLRIFEIEDAIGIASKKHTDLMAGAGCLWHDGVDGTPSERMADEGYLRFGGENCAMQTLDPSSPFKGWYNSPRHHRNMLTGGFTQVGIGQNDKFWTANFGTAPYFSVIKDAEKLFEQINSDKTEIWQEAVTQLKHYGEPAGEAMKIRLFQKNKKILAKYCAIRKKKIEALIPSSVEYKKELQKKREAAWSFIARYTKEQQTQVDALVEEIRALYFGNVPQINNDKELAALVDMLTVISSFMVDVGARTEKGQKSQSAISSLVDSFLKKAKEKVEDELLKGILLSKSDNESLKFNEKLKDKLSAGEYEVVVLTNEYRMVMGKNALKVDIKLVTASRKHSREMKELNYFAHESPVKGNETFALRAAAEGTTALCENIANYSTARDTFNGWYHSPGHHINMLLTAQVYIGIGQCENLWTEMFN